jgi:hypothetical protein
MQTGMTIKTDGAVQQERVEPVPTAGDWAVSSGERSARCWEQEEAQHADEYHNRQLNVGNAIEHRIRPDLGLLLLTRYPKQSCCIQLLLCVWQDRGGPGSGLQSARIDGHSRNGIDAKAVELLHFFFAGDASGHDELAVGGGEQIGNDLLWKPL